MLHYCKRCGKLRQRYDDDEKRCEFCNYVIQPVPNVYLIRDGSSIIKPELEQEFMEKYIWSSPEFDPERHKQMKQWLDTRWDNRPEKKVGNPYGIECPYCHSTFIERIGGITRALFTDASAVGKQFQCLNCKAYF